MNPPKSGISAKKAGKSIVVRGCITLKLRQSPHFNATKNLEYIKAHRACVSLLLCLLLVKFSYVCKKSIITFMLLKLPIPFRNNCLQIFHFIDKIISQLQYYYIKLSFSLK
jgi:hypothetical protein